MDNKVMNIKNIIITIVLILLVITIGTYAWLTYRSNDTAMVLTIGDLNNVQITLKPYQLDLELDPVLTYTSLDTNNEYVTITVVNNSSREQSFSLFYDINYIDSGLQNNTFKYTLLRTNDNTTTEGNFANAATSENLFVLRDSIIPANTTYTYKMYTWLDGNSTNTSGLVFKGDLNAKIGNDIPTFVISNAVIDNISSSYVTNQSGVQFDGISSDTNGKGIYIMAGTEDDEHPIYYYRGAVDNNNLLFANFCWKIVRTTDTGGIKLIYNGLPSGANNDKCTNTTGNSTQLETETAFYEYTGYDSPADVGYMYGTRYVTSSLASNQLATPYLYGNSFTYSNGTYTLTDTITSSGDWNNDYTTLNNNHYTCFNTTGTCSSINYIHTTKKMYALYITLSNGKSVANALDEMLTNSSNQYSSTVKTYIDNWYSTYMTNYTSYLEDTIWCNDRSISALNGWNPNGGSTYGSSWVDYALLFGGTNRYITHNPSLECTSKNDSFTVNESSKGNGKLTYPVGLLTADEIMMAGGKTATANSAFYLYTNKFYWTGTPTGFVSSTCEYALESSGTMNGYVLSYTYGVRPSVSLKPGTVISSGNGTANNPYVVE